MVALKILIVDDSPTVRRLIKSTLEKYLQSQGLSLDLSDAPNGVEALGRLRQKDYDLIISDWEMPEMTGDALLHEMKENPKWCSIPFLMVTQRNDRDAIITAVQAGVSDYLIKPFTSLDLVSKVQRLIKKSEQRIFERYASTHQMSLLFSHGDQSFKGNLINISLGGLLGRFPIPPEPLITEVVSIDIQHGLYNLISINGLKGIVLRLEADFQAGANMCKIAVRFFQLTQEKITELSNFVSSLKTIEPGLTG